MRSEANAETVRQVIQAIGAESQGPGTVFLTGGGSAVLYGWRESTVDVDLKLDPEPAGVFAAIAMLKQRLDVNIELASPDLFLPAVPGWRERSPEIGQVHGVTFRHYDFDSQALAKVERGHGRDLDDVRAMLRLGLTSVEAIEQAHQDVCPLLERYPSVDPDALAAKVSEFCRGQRDGA